MKIFLSDSNKRHLDRSRAALSRGAVERPLYLAFTLVMF